MRSQKVRRLLVVLIAVILLSLETVVDSSMLKRIYCFASLANNGGSDAYTNG
jgi:hypothetical protein